MWSTTRIRKHFLEYFEQHGHTVVSSSPLVPRNDPTLLFTNAGMVQFKNVFTGAEKRDYTRAASSQRCVRAGGKHNDLENVGYTARHHTFFEMLGNFSFGDYFKEEAILLAWNLITKEFGLPKEKLLVTVYNEDDEAAGLWKKVAGLSDDRIIRIAGSDNFWAMGDTGPCGPCSEIFYDHGEGIPGGPPGSPEQDGDRFIEIWNLVFMQYEQLATERLSLPKPSIDTGMGLERITAVMQGVHNNYEIDLFQALIRASEDVSGVKAAGAHLASHRVIADHLRASCFLMTDGVMPSNEGRGYVLRRIMRRAMRHAYLLGCKDPMMTQLVPALVAEMGEAYPELMRAQSVMSETLRLEEERFRQTLGRGMKLLEDETTRLGAGAQLPGDVAFKLYDTYGFPLDLTQDILRSEGRSVALDGFDAAMAKQKADARAAWSGSGEAQDETIWFGLREKCGATEFLGYTTDAAQGQVQALVQKGVEVQAAKPGDDVLIILNQTPFYGESGGQMGDAGVLTSDAGARIEIQTTLKKLGDLHVHQGRLVAGTLAVGDELTLQIDAARRTLLRANHSATHLLHAVLRKTLGDQVTQKGSLVAPDRLRFDYSFTSPLSPDQIQAVEDEVNTLIRRNTETQTKVMRPEDAVSAGAMALFGEKYGDEVRVVSMGALETTGPNAYSVELCGGTHVARTGDIGYFKILSETGIAAGIRRIEAVTGPGAEQYMAERESTLVAAAGLLKARPEDLLARIATLQEDKRRLEKDIKELNRKMMQGGGSAETIETFGGVRFLSRVMDGVPASDLKSLADQLKQQVGSGIVAIGSSVDGKGSIVVAVTADLTAHLSAVDMVKVAATALGGTGGGGRADMAQAGGPNGAQIDAAFAAIAEALTARGT